MKQLFLDQKEYFNRNKTKSYDFRLKQLKRLKKAILDNEALIVQALKKDLNKSATESYMTEIGMVLSEISFAIRHLKRWMKPRKVATPVSQMIAKSRIYKEPYGVVLVIAPWNYPVMLSMAPIVSAMAAGNTVILKPSELAPATAEVLEKIIMENFEPSYFSVCCGDVSVASELLTYPFDFIFYTGSSRVGKIVMEQASKHLTPVILELGGKSPVIVDETAAIHLAAKRIIFGKMMNAGQTCVAPDYVFVEKSKKEALLQVMKEELQSRLGNYAQNGDFPKIITERHLERLQNLLIGENILCGGTATAEKLDLTLVDASTDSKLMEEEIFGPILPILTYEHIEDVIDYIKSKEKPLALYIFSTKRATIYHLIQSLSYGGGCVNDTIVHLATSKLPFGGVGASGMGHYHGKQGFDSLSHDKSILFKSNKLDIGVRYQPYSKKKEKLIRKLLK